MIYTDKIHLISDKSIDELINFAILIGLKKEWIQKHRIIHFDILSNRILNKALKNGAVLVNTKDLIRKYKKGF